MSSAQVSLIQSKGEVIRTLRDGCRVRVDDPAIRPFRKVNWRKRFRAAYMRRHGEVDGTAYRLLEAYFCLAMAVCTEGIQRRARLLKGTWALNAAAALAGLPGLPSTSAPIVP